MTLNQFYDQEAKYLGYTCWNQMCAIISLKEREQFKKSAKRAYKEKKIKEKQPLDIEQN